MVISEFIKFNKDKLRYELIELETIDGLAKVLTYGAKKYKANNWKNCKDQKVWIGAFFRHFQAWRNGEIIDPESGLPHLYHAITNLSFMIYLDSFNTKVVENGNKDD